MTSFTPEEWPARELYEDLYCARGEMENRIKEQQLDLFADRVSCHWERGNQTRMYYSAIAYALLEALRRLGLAGTEMARAQCGTGAEGDFVARPHDVGRERPLTAATHSDSAEFRG